MLTPEEAAQLLVKPDVEELIKANVQLKLLNEKMSTQEGLLTNILGFVHAQERLLTEIRGLLGTVAIVLKKGENE